MGSTPLTMEADFRITADLIERRFFSEPWIRGSNDLLAAVRFEVLPILFRHKATVDANGLRQRSAGQNVLDRLSELLCGSERDAADRAGAVLISGAADTEARIRMLAAVARRLGRSWRDDTLSFLDVTLGMARIQHLFFSYCSPDSAVIASRRERSVLLTTAPGEQHVFGLSIAEHAFRSSKWSVDVLVPESVEALVARLVERPSSIVCVSWSSGHLKDRLLKFLKAIQAMPVDSRPVVLAGGYSAERNATLLGEHGVHAVCDDALTVADCAERSIGRTPGNGRWT